MKILLIKLSSLGDILHNLPIVWDLRKYFSHAEIDWVVEENYSALLEPLRTCSNYKGIDNIIHLNFRKWKKDLQNNIYLQPLQEFFKFKRELQKKKYDLIIDTQGLIKSAYIAYLANKKLNTTVIGLANKTKFSGYEPLCRIFYTQSIQVPLYSHAINRSRLLANAAIRLIQSNRNFNPPKFYPRYYVESLYQTNNPNIVFNFSMHQLGFDIQKPYILFFHATSKKSKCWPNENWISLGRILQNSGLSIILPWGDHIEKENSLRLAKQFNGIVPKAFNIETAMYLIANAKLVIGVDTGLTHLSAILNTPTIELYCSSPKWKTECYWSSNVLNIGDMNNPPDVKDVERSIQNLFKN